MRLWQSPKLIFAHPNRCRFSVAAIPNNQTTSIEWVIFNPMNMARPKRFELPTLWFVALRIKLRFGLVLQPLDENLCPKPLRLFCRF